MRQVTRKGLITVAAASGVLATFSGGTAFADGTQGASGSSGLLAGNNVQAPINVPVNVCGNTVSVAGVLSPSVGNSCGNGGSGSGDNGSSQTSDTAGDSTGVGSGNNVQAPVNVPVNVCGNSVSALGQSSPAAGNGCGDSSVEVPPEEPPGNPDEPGNPEEPGTPDEPGPEQPPTDEEPGLTPDAERGPETTDVRAQSAPVSGELAQTGSDGIGIAAPLSAGLLVGGFVLYRRARVASRR